MILITILSCHVRDYNVKMFLVDKHYSGVKVYYHNYFYATMETDSIKSGIINAYGKLYLINKHDCRTSRLPEVR